ncbi:MAG: TlpA disulfide reductase family protein [Tepidisphaeraceae bacterium]
MIVIDYWATWCAPCRAYVPRLREFYNKQHGNGLEIISVSLDSEGEENLAKLKKAIVDEQMPWHHYYPGQGFESVIASAWGVNSIPRLFVIDREGKLFNLDAREKLEEIVTPLLEAKQ